MSVQLEQADVDGVNLDLEQVGVDVCYSSLCYNTYIDVFYNRPIIGEINNPLFWQITLILVTRRLQVNSWAGKSQTIWRFAAIEDFLA